MTDLLTELLSKQLKDIPIDKKLRFSDLRRICKYISGNIFDESTCCLWSGYVTNLHHITKGVYVNLYFKGKKTALHRLLYINFVGPLSDDEYLKFNCENKGKCCSVNHLKKFKYVKKEEVIKTIEAKGNRKGISKINENDIKTSDPNKKFIISFD